MKFLVCSLDEKKNLTILGQFETIVEAYNCERSLKTELEVRVYKLLVVLS